MTRMGTMMLSGGLALGLGACAADRGDDSPALTPVEEWSAEPEHEFGDRFEGDALFGLIVDVRSTVDGSGVYVLDGGTTKARSGVSCCPSGSGPWT